MKGVNGKETPYKQDDFRILLNHHINVCSKVMNKNPWASRCYYYFDMFGGPGLIEEGDRVIKGSPVIFLESIGKFPLSYQAEIVEQDIETFIKLSLSVSDRQIKLHHSNSGIAYKQFLPKSPNKKQFGLLYLDPDMSEDGFDLSFKIAQDFAHYYPVLDIILYISTNNIKRISGAKGTPNLIERLKPIHKTDCVIRTLRDKFQYTFLVLTNYPKPFQWSNMGFHDVKSEQGRAIFEKANYTKEEIKKKYQPSLTGLMQNTSDIPNLELSERKQSKEQKASVRDAIKGRLRKFIT